MGEQTGAELKSCMRCGTMFLYSGIGKCYCGRCKEDEEADFNLVKDYIYENPSSMLQEVADATGVKITRIKSYLKDGRLIIPDGSAVFLNCEVCGTKIKFGRVCRSCADALSSEMKSIMNVNEYSIGDKPNQDSHAKMRFLDGR